MAVTGCLGTLAGESCPDGDVGTVSGDWSAHGGNPGHTGATDAGGFDSAPETRWCAGLEGHTRSLLLLDGTLVEYERVGGVNDRTHHLQAHDASDGTRLWRRRLDDEPIGGIAAADGGVYYTMDGEDADGVFRHVTTDGARDWAVDLPEPTDSPPAVSDGSVYVSDTVGGVHALEAATGDSLWSTDLADSFDPTLSGDLPAVAGGAVFVGSAIGRGPAALDTTDGSVLWQRDLDGFFDPMSDGDVVLGGTDGEMYAVEASTGETRWRLQKDQLSLEAVTGDAVYCTRGRDLVAYDVADGSRRWVRAPPAPLEEVRGVTIAATDDTLLVVDEAGAVGGEGIVGLDPASGERTWGVEPDASGIAVGDGVAFTFDTDRDSLLGLGV